MRIRNKKAAISSLLKIRFLGQRMPLAVRWQLTNRCVSKCSYCNLWQTPRSELRLDQIVSLLDEMVKRGTQTISFSGGEPMLRQDIGSILEETARRGISTEMNSGGVGIAERIREIRYLDFLKMSLDGPEEVHDLMRGENAYKTVMRAAAVAKENGLKFIFSTTLTKYNIRDVGFFLETAKKFDTLVAFQPLKRLYKGLDDISGLEPTRDEYRQAVLRLIDEKKKGNPHLRNSLIGLRHILHWPQYPRLKCWAGRVFCVLNTDGVLMPCDRIACPSQLPNCLKTGFATAFAALPEVNCQGCGFCGVLELNFTLSFRLGTMESVYKVLK